MNTSSATKETMDGSCKQCEIYEQNITQLYGMYNQFQKEMSSVNNRISEIDKMFQAILLESKCEFSIFATPLNKYNQALQANTFSGEPLSTSASDVFKAVVDHSSCHDTSAMVSGEELTSTSGVLKTEVDDSSCHDTSAMGEQLTFAARVLIKSESEYACGPEMLGLDVATDDTENCRIKTEPSQSTDSGAFDEFTIKRTVSKPSCSGNGGNKRRKRHFCIYCQKSVVYLNKHFMKRHKSVEEVKQALMLPPKEKLMVFKQLKNKGDYRHSLKAKELKVEKLGQFRKSNQQIEPSTNSQVPCPNCLGFFKSTYLARHTRACQKAFQKPKGELWRKARDI